MWYLRSFLTRLTANVFPPKTEVFHPNPPVLNLFTIVTGHGFQRRRNPGQGVRQPADEAAVEVPAPIQMEGRTGTGFHRAEGGSRRPRPVPHPDRGGQVSGAGSPDAFAAGGLAQSESSDRHWADRRYLRWPDLLQLPARIL